MSHPFQAKFEHGLFRPLEPIDLADQSIVSLVVVTGAPPSSGQDDVNAHQRAALASSLEKAKELADVPDEDGLTNRDHDRLIYGP